MRRQRLRHSGSSYLGQGDFVYRHTPVPVFTKAKGSILEDEDGFRYLCADAANGTAGLGFDATIAQEAVELIRDIPSVPSFCESEIRLETARKFGALIERATRKKGRVAFELGGAQGIELALRIAKANKGKAQYVVFEGGYHGRSAYTAQLSASHRYRAAMGEWRIPMVRLPYPDYEQSGQIVSKKQWMRQYLQRVDELLSRETAGAHSNNAEPDITALLLEPVLNAGGIVKHEKSLLEGIVERFRKAGALIISDEIFCGMYRTGPLFGFQQYDFTPDIIVLSKAITNGITPLSCVWARDPFLKAECFPPGSHSATFINQPFGLAVANVVLDRYAKWRTRKDDIATLEKSLKNIVRTIAHDSRCVQSSLAFGGVARILLKTNRAGKILDIARGVAKKNPVHGVHGLILASTSMTPNVITINPPLTMSDGDIGILRELLSRTFKIADDTVA